MMIELPPLPARMQRRPRDARGFPIPFSQFIDKDGKPDFRVLDDNKVRDCLSARLCGLCGQPMGQHIYFIGGNLCVRNGIFSDPPMHRECAVFALTACIHLNRTKGKFNTAVPLPDATIGVATLSSDEKCEWFALMHAKKYEWARAQDRMIYIRARLPWLDVELWQDGKPMPRRRQVIK